MVGAAHTANISACMSNVTFSSSPSQSDPFKMVGYSDGTISMDDGSMNFQIVETEGQASETNVTYLTWDKAKKNSSYQTTSGSYYHGFNLNNPSRRQYLIKYENEYPGLQVLPNPCSVDNPRWREGNYCIFVEFNVNITLSSEYMDGKPFVAAHVAPDTCPDFSVCRGTTLVLLPLTAILALEGCAVEIAPPTQHVLMEVAVTSPLVLHMDRASVFGVTKVSTAHTKPAGV